MINQIMVEDIHKNAVEHGWWEGNRTFGEIIALCHSEMSEALEEYRKGKKLSEIYFEKAGKPEGISVELADCIIRILDYFGYIKIDYKIYPVSIIEFKEINYDFAEFVTRTQLYISKAYELNSLSYLKGAVEYIFEYLTYFDIPIIEIINLKHAFNKTRSYKHGNKVI